MLLFLLEQLFGLFSRSVEGVGRECRTEARPREQAGYIPVGEQAATISVNNLRGRVESRIVNLVCVGRIWAIINVSPCTDRSALRDNL